LVGAHFQNEKIMDAVTEYFNENVLRITEMVFSSYTIVGENALI